MVDTRKFFQDFYNQRPTNASQMTILTIYNVLTKPSDKVQSNLHLIYSISSYTCKVCVLGLVQLFINSLYFYIQSEMNSEDNTK